jgi:hypothetical protein
VSIDHLGADGDYMVEFTGPRAGPVMFPGLRVEQGHGAIGRTTGGDVRGLADVKVMDAAGAMRYHATISPD